MKRIFLLLLAVASCACAAAAQTAWQYGRIIEVRKSVETKTKAWVVNTPISEDLITYTVSVQVMEKIVTGTFELTPEDSGPPPEWTTNYPVKVQVVGDRLYVRGPTGEARLHVVRRKLAKLAMTPLTAEEKKQLEQMEAPSGSSMVG